ncbi:hypothetical protein [Roseburia sp. AM16-25]|uniref:hypothetical protein n=1 Tax=Roseburia sp. AM16-25 TaxID=2292065 RepID=UPI000E4B925A|nr:hypothetical protein [Roseburia sp. AM16-25]RHO33379.1 hypothetical protein DW183_02700 [Roseburia sp. AM16-25]
MGIEKTMSQMPKKKQISRFMWLLILLSCAIFFLDYDERVLPYNSTILAFSYKYGFISRGLAGTIYQWIDHILPVNMIDYAMVLRFTLIVTLVFYVLFFAFCYQCMKRCQEEYLGRFLYLILFYAVFVVSMFAYKRNFGRLDLYLMALTVIGTMCLIAKKAEWLIVPLSMISVMYHQGYVFMFYNILLALLVYRILSEKEKKARIYYGVILLVSLIGCSALFLWFEFFSHTDGARYVDEIIANAKAMTKPFNGMTYHDTLIDHEILGIDLSDVEYPYRVMNWIEIPFFIAIISPYIVLAVKLFRRILARAQGKTERLKYGFLAIAAGTLLPLFLMKCDYARWVFALISYYCMIFLALVAMGDRIVAEELTGIFTEIKEKYPFAILLLLLPALLTPFWDVHINGLLRGISNPINETFLNLW